MRLVSYFISYYGFLWGVHMGQESSNYQKRVLTIPNGLSLLRLCMIPLLIWLYGVKENGRMTIWVLALSGLTDMADGYIARRFHMISDLGKALDPIADKLTQAAMLLCLLTRFRMMLFPLLLLALKDLSMGLTRLVLIRRTGVVMGAEWHGKVTTFLLYAMMILHLLWPDIPYAVSTCVIFICVGMMLVSFALYGAKLIRELRGK